MEAARKQNMFGLDRPNPIRGDMVEGPLDYNFRTFVDIILYQYAMEVRLVISKKNNKGGFLIPELTVIPLEVGKKILV